MVTGSEEVAGALCAQTGDASRHNVHHQSEAGWDRFRCLPGVLKVRGSFAQHAHRIFQPLEGQREHAVAHQLLDDGDALAVLPDALRLGVDPGELGEGVRLSLIHISEPTRRS